MGGFTIPGGSSVQPALVAYRAVTLSANTTLVWPNQSVVPTDFAARVMNVTATVGALSLALPPANQVSTGFDLVISNVGGNSFNLTNNGGGVIATITAGQRYYLNLTDNTTANGVWDSFLFGAGSSTLSAGAVANSSYDVVAIGAFLHSNHTVTSTSSSPITINADGVTSRGQTFEWTGGAGAVNLPLASAVGNGFYFYLVNWGTGSLTITPTGGDTIDTASTQTLIPGNACIVISGAAGTWFTLGRGTLQNFNFTEAVISVTGGTLVESNTQAQNVIQKFTGALGSNQIVTFPGIVQIYYVQNATSGAFNLTFGAAGGGSTVPVPQGQNMILFSDGTNVVNASNAQIGALSSITLATGSAGAPSLNFTGDVTTGLFQPVATTLAVSLGGTERARFTATGLQVNAFLPTGSSIPSNGIYLPAANTLGFAVNSAQIMQLDGVAGLTVTVGSTSTTGFLLSGTENGATAVYGYRSNQTFGSTVTSTAAGYYSSLSTAAAAFTLTNLHNFLVVDGVKGAGSTITNQYGFYCGDLTVGASNYGYRSEVSAGSGKWGLYMNGTASNYLAGTTQVGSTTATAGILQVTQAAGSDVATFSINEAALRSVVHQNTNAGGGMALKVNANNGAVLGIVAAQTSGVFGVGTLSNNETDLLVNNTAVIKMATTTSATYQGDSAGFSELGWRGAPVVSVSGAGSTAAVVAWRGQSIQISGSSTGITINASTFSAGDLITGDNTLGGNITITAGASVTLRLAGTATTGNRTVAQHGLFSIYCEVGGATPTLVVSGAGVS